MSSSQSLCICLLFIFIYLLLHGFYWLYKSHGMVWIFFLLLYFSCILWAWLYLCIKYGAAGDVCVEQLFTASALAEYNSQMLFRTHESPQVFVAMSGVLLVHSVFTTLSIVSIWILCAVSVGSCWWGSALVLRRSTPFCLFSCCRVTFVTRKWCGVGSRGLVICNFFGDRRLTTSWFAHSYLYR